MSEVKFYKLGPNQSIFWDPTQSDKNNQKLVSNWCLPLEETLEMTTAKRNERIVPANEVEVAAYYKSIGKTVPVAEEGEEEGEEKVPVKAFKPSK
jgi:hypothetical protein